MYQKRSLILWSNKHVMWKFGVVEKGERRFFNGLKKKVKQIEIERILILLLQVYNTGQ